MVSETGDKSRASREVGGEISSLLKNSLSRLCERSEAISGSRKSITSRLLRRKNAPRNDNLEVIQQPFRELLIPVAAVLLFGASLAAGAEWKPVAKSSSGVPLYYDAESVETQHTETVTVWTKAVFRECEHPVAGLEGYDYSIALIEINCKEKEYIIRQVVVYDREGDSFSAYSPRWGFLPPELQLERLFEIVCP